MKHRTNTNLFLFQIFLILFFTSCKDYDRPEPEFEEEFLEEVLEPVGGTIQETLNSQTELSNFAKAYSAFEYPDFVYTYQTYTVFAPVNDVFPGFEGINKNSKSSIIDQLIPYYILTDSFTFDELLQIATRVPSIFSFVISLNGEKMYLRLEDETIILKGHLGKEAKIIRSFDASNGVIHVIDNNIVPTPLK